MLGIKGGLKPGQLLPDGSEQNIRRSVDECLRVLDGKKKVDIFECARQDPNTSVEQTVTILGKLVEEGKIGGVGLTEVDAETIRRACVLSPPTHLSYVVTNAYAVSTEPRCAPSRPSRSNSPSGTLPSSKTTSPKPATNSTSPSPPTPLSAGARSPAPSQAKTPSLRVTTDAICKSFRTSIWCTTSS